MKQWMIVPVAALALLGVASLGAGCHRQGPAEHVGSKLDQAAQKAKDKVDPPGPAQKAGRAVDKATGGQD